MPSQFFNIRVVEPEKLSIPNTSTYPDTFFFFRIFESQNRMNIRFESFRSNFLYEKSGNTDFYDITIKPVKTPNWCEKVPFTYSGKTWVLISSLQDVLVLSLTYFLEITDTYIPILESLRQIYDPWNAHNSLSNGV